MLGGIENLFGENDALQKLKLLFAPPYMIQNCLNLGIENSNYNLDILHHMYIDVE